MTRDEDSTGKQGKGQARRLSTQHLERGGVAGIFGPEAQVHDASIRTVTRKLRQQLEKEFPHLKFRVRRSIKKEEIHERLQALDERLGKQLFVPGASIQPDGGVMEVLDATGDWRVILIGESKHQGNDVTNISLGNRTPVMEKKGQYIMPAGNAIERVHKNIQEMKNFMLGERHFPYVVLLQGSNFATEPVCARWPDGDEILILPDDASVNRIDRVTASTYGMAINESHVANIRVALPKGSAMLQVASVYAQCHAFTPVEVYAILRTTALASLALLIDELPPAKNEPGGAE